MRKDPRQAHWLHLPWVFLMALMLCSGAFKQPEFFQPYGVLALRTVVSISTMAERISMPSTR